MWEWNDDGDYPKELGLAFQVDYSLGHNARQSAMDDAIASARETLPKGKVFEIRAQNLPFEGHGTTEKQREKEWAVAWYCFEKDLDRCESRRIKKWPLFQNDVDNPLIMGLGGYLLLARIKA